MYYRYDRYGTSGTRDDMENAFDLLHEEVRDLAKGRFKTPTPIQRMVIPEVMAGKNVLILSETGSGKTESALLPIFDRMQRESMAPISTLYMTPLRSLNRDLLGRITWWSKELGFDVSVRHGDTPQYERSMHAQNPPDMMISTPETLQALLTGKLMRAHLANVKFIVIDEVHELVTGKRGVQLSVGLERLKNLIRGAGGKDPQIVCLSATVGNPQEVAGYFMRDAKVINTEKGERVRLMVVAPSPVKTSKALDDGTETDAKHRMDFIASAIEKKQSMLVFTNTREAAERLSSRLKSMRPDLPVQTHHSSLSREVRMKAEDEFKAGKLKALLCTSSLELGIDVGLVDFVIQYNSPRQVSKMLQRVGRAGHSLGRTSEGVIITTGVDDAFEAAVIAKLAMEGKMEPCRVYGQSLDVLAHQAVGMSMELWKTPLSEILGTAVRATPFHALRERDVLDVCVVMQKAGYAWLNVQEPSDPDGEEKLVKMEQILASAKLKGWEKALFPKLVLKRRKPAFTYYFGNLTTIPDVKNYKVFDIASRQNVGTLDAEFVSLHGGPGAEFIVNGHGWRVIEITSDRILAEPLHSYDAAIPAWEGELIPIPYDVSQEVGKLRAAVKKDGKAALDDWPVAPEVTKMMIDAVKKQERMPEASELALEYGLLEGDAYLVVHSCFGSLVNETIGRAVSSLLASKFGSIGIKADAYRMVFRLGDITQWRAVADVLRGMKPEIMREILELSLPDTDLFRWRFSHVARRFGIISRDADVGKPYLKKVIDAYRGTPVFRETLNELFQEKLDVEKASEVLRLMASGKVRVTENADLSYFARLGIMRRYELVGEPKPEHEVFSIFRQRILDTKTSLICTNCATVAFMGSIGEASTTPCKRCGSSLLAMAPIKHVQDAKAMLEKHIGKKAMTSEEKAIVDRLLATSYLIVASGVDAIKVLSGHGVGPSTAGRILAKMSKDDDLLRDILEAEKNYAKTRRFWQDR